MTHSHGTVKEITSVSNPIVKDIKTLAQKKYRDRQGAFLAEGHKLILDAMASDWKISTLIFAKSERERDDVAKLAARVVASGNGVLEVSQKVLSSITRRDNPQMVIGVFAQHYQPLQTINPQAGEIWLALDRVRDPGNLGTIIRTSDAVGVKGIILVGDTTDPYSSEAVRASMGSIFNVPLIRATTPEFLKWQSKWPGRTIGTHLEGAVDYRKCGRDQRATLLLMGNEQQGLSDELTQACDQLAMISQVGDADSLNLAIATAVMLYELRRDNLPKLKRETGDDV